MWKNTVERGRPHMTIWRMHIVCWTPKNTHTHNSNIVAFPLQQWLQERTTVLCYTIIACLVPNISEYEIILFVHFVTQQEFFLKQ